MVFLPDDFTVLLPHILCSSEILEAFASLDTIKCHQEIKLPVLWGGFIAIILHARCEIVLLCSLLTWSHMLFQTIM